MWLTWLNRFQWNIYYLWSPSDRPLKKKRPTQKHQSWCYKTNHRSDKQGEKQPTVKRRCITVETGDDIRLKGERMNMSVPAWRFLWPASAGSCSRSHRAAWSSDQTMFSSNMPRISTEWAHAGPELCNTKTRRVLLKWTQRSEKAELVVCVCVSGRELLKGRRDKTSQTVRHINCAHDEEPLLRRKNTKMSLRAGWNIGCECHSAANIKMKADVLGFCGS